MTEGSPAHAGMDLYPPLPPLSPRRLPRTRGDGPSAMASDGDGRNGSPAHAGMDPPPPHCPPGLYWLPRTRGDGPLLSGFSRYKGMAPPHTRGWTAIGYLPAPTPAWLPRTRGDGPETGIEAGSFVLGSPAHAGMDLRWGLCNGESTRLPRTRGGMDPD